MAITRATRSRFARNPDEAIYQHLWDGLQGCYDFSLGPFGLLARDFSLYRNHGVFIAGISESANRIGPLGYEINLPGAGATRPHISLPLSAQTNIAAGDHTVYGMVRWNTSTPGVFPAIVSLAPYATTTVGPKLALMGGSGNPLAGDVTYVFSQDNATQATGPNNMGPNTLNSGLYQHFIAVVKGGILTFYWNKNILTGTNTARGIGKQAEIGEEVNIGSPWTGQIRRIYFWNRALNVQEVFLLTDGGSPLATRAPVYWSIPGLFASPPGTTIIATPSRVLTQTSAASVNQVQLVTATPSRVLTATTQAIIPQAILATPSKVLTRATIPVISRVILATPSKVLARTAASPAGYNVSPNALRVLARTPTARAAIGYTLRDCGTTYDIALAQKFIFGDWIIQAPDIGLKLSFTYDPDGTWEHRIFDISPIEITAPPGGGLAAVANVTIKVIEDGLGQSILEIWERSSFVESAEVTIDFLLHGENTALRMFTGRIDQIIINNAVSEILCVDDTIHRNFQLPQDIIDSTVFPNADSRALTQPRPLIYGRGSIIGAAPLLLIDTTTNTYLVAGHAMNMAGNLAIFDSPTTTFVTLNGLIPLNDPASSTLTLGTLDTGVMQYREYNNVINLNGAVDGNSLTLTKVGTDVVNSTTDGIGYAGYTTGQVGYPHTTTIQITLTRHRRSPGSDPTTTGTFLVRTLNPSTGAVVRNLTTAGPYNHVTSAQNNIITLSGTTIALNELLEVLLLASHTGGPGGASNTYEVGEISITPVQVFSANTFNSLTAVTVPITIQDLRFNPVSYALALLVQTAVSGGAFAIDGLSSPPATVGTTAVDSNLDGYGELIVTASTSAATQRANNTVIIDLVNHRRGRYSDPTVTGTVSVQTLNQATNVVLRDNLFVTQAFRHSLNPQITSYVANSINLGRTAQLAVRLVARNEGGIGAASNFYEVGEIAINSFYQPTGDSSVLFLYQGGWTGRFDPDGSVTSYCGLGAGTLLTSPDEVIASILLQELGTGIDTDSFAVAHTFFNGLGYTFNGGIGGEWAVNRNDGRNILHQLAIQSKSIIAPTFTGNFGLRVYGIDQSIHQSFDISNILCTEGADRQEPHERDSTFNITLGDLSTVANRVEVHYAYNVGSRKYDKILYADGANGGTTNSTDGISVSDLCSQSVIKYGKLEPKIIEAYWIADDFSATVLLRHLVDYFSAQRLRIEFETTMVAACIQVGDIIDVTYPLLPTLDNGESYEVHTIRYMPIQGRVHIVASRQATLGISLRPGLGNTLPQMKARTPAATIRNSVVHATAIQVKAEAPQATITYGFAFAWTERWEYPDYSATVSYTDF